VPRERHIDTILMWVGEPSMPIKMCVRGAGGEFGRVFTGGAASVGGLFRFQVIAETKHCAPCRCRADHASTIGAGHVLNEKIIVDSPVLAISPDSQATYQQDSTAHARRFDTHVSSRNCRGSPPRTVDRQATSQAGPDTGSLRPPSLNAPRARHATCGVAFISGERPGFLRSETVARRTLPYRRRI
jgi:hypothetical protein